MKTLDLVFFDAGGGHRSAANALCEAARREARPWDMQMMNLQELLDEIDVIRKLTGLRLQDVYNLMLQRGWTLGSTQMLPVMQRIIRVYHSQQVKLLEKYWRKHRPDMVISVIPNLNRAIFDAMKGVLPGVPMVTILTDMADYPPHFWMERQPQYLICGTQKAYAQALQIGHSKDRIFLTSGMILHPRYYEPEIVDRVRDREALGLDASLPTILMMFGGEGSSKMLDIARNLNASGLPLQIIAICGKNQRLQAALHALPRRIPMHVEGFTKEVPRFMRLSDMFIGKPGPGSISEAVAMGLPVIVESNQWTLPQERYNAEWVEEQGVGIALKSFRREVVDAVRRMLEPDQRAGFSACVGMLKNRAVFEIPDMLEEIMNRER
jgi:UDP-N-acetylglucosamine:LPS N-acetylglucosamine transferase